MVQASSLATSDYKKHKSVLKGAVNGQVVTRFPPEPSGYLHIGHVKAAMMNFHYAKMHEGKMILRFDDTNPMNEKIEFVDNIINDLKTLDITPDQITYSSDHFEMLQNYMRQLIQEGKAYADNTPAEEMKEKRDAGEETVHRNNTPEKNLQFFEGMLRGENKDYCIRAKLNMQDKVKCLRDPVFYRTKDIPHHRTGETFKAYPTYDFTCPIVDSHEGVTHALRTIEYRDRNALYEWVQKTLNLRPVVIYDFSKLNLLSTCLSKRKLRWFVENDHVDGWSDPRFPTIQGIMRRGMTAEALKQFMLEQGPSRNTVNMEWDKLWAVNKQILDPVVPRYTCIGKATAIKLTIENGPETPEARTQALHPKNASIGNKAVIYGKNVIIEKDDAKDLKVGQKFTLMKWGNATVTRREESGDSFELFATIDEADKDFKGTAKLTWICNDPATTVEVSMKEFDHLIKKAKIEEDDDIEQIFNRNSRFEDIGIAEGVVKTLPKGSYFQFERRGYYYVDNVALVSTKMVVNFVPDGKTKGISVLSHQVDASETAKGKEGVGGTTKQVAATGPDGKMSKKALAKLQKKEAKNSKKAGGAAAAAGDDKKQQGKPKGGDKQGAKPAASKSAASSSQVFGGAAADLWEGLLSTNQWFGGIKPSQADAQAVKHLGTQMPDPEKHPNLFGWAAIAKKFKEDVSKTWTAGQLQLPAGGIQAASSSAAPAQSKSNYFSGAAANLWEQMLSSSGTQWLLGAKPTQADVAAAKELGTKKPNPATHPNLFAWAAIVTKFSEAVTSKWPAGDLPRPQGASASKASKDKKSKKESDSSSSSDSDSDDDKKKKKGKKDKKDKKGGKKDKKEKKGKDEKKKDAAPAAEDDFDPFADDPEADAAAAESMKKKAEEAKTKKKKAAPVAKSLIIWEVKPWGEDTDLNALAAKIIGIQMDGLFWKTEWKKEPVAYGIFKIQIGATVEDDKVSTDLVQEKIEEFEDDVQSVDIVAFNKL